MLHNRCQAELDRLEANYKDQINRLRADSADHSRCEVEITRLSNLVSDLQEQLQRQAASHQTSIERLLEHLMGLATPENLAIFRRDPEARAERVRRIQEEAKAARAQAMVSNSPFRQHGPPQSKIVEEAILKQQVVGGPLD